MLYTVPMVKISDKPHNYWFKRRRYGWGWIPVTWQGWLSLLVFVLVVINAAFLLPPKPERPTILNLVLFLLIVLSAILILAGVAYAKGPTPHWRWGKKPSDDQDEDY